MNTPSTRPLKIFLCHASADKPAVRKLYRYLRSKGMDPWLDEFKLLPGQRWEEEIPKALYDSDAIIVVLSQNSITKEGYVQREIKFALDKALDMPEGRIFLIPARLEECEVPVSLRGYQWVDLFQKNWNRRLLSSLNIRSAQLGLTPLAASGETQPPVVNTPVKPLASHAQFVPPETEETFVKPNPLAEKSITAEPSQTQTISINGEIKKQSIPNALPHVISPKKVEQERKEKISVEPSVPPSRSTPLGLPQEARKVGEKSSHKVPGQKKIVPKFNLLTIGRVVVFMLVVALIIWSGRMILNNSSIDGPTATARVYATQQGATVEMGLARQNATIQAGLTQTALAPAVISTATLVPATQTSAPVITSLAIDSTMTGKDNMTLLYVPAGEFTMGSDNGESDEAPAHTVYLNALWIDKTEVTLRMYYLCVRAGVCKEPTWKTSHIHSSYYGASDYDNYPVIYVDWNMARTYCEWVDRRLPTEAEWEKAARDSDVRTYPWGNDAPNNNLLNYNSAVEDTTEVGKYTTGASSYGALDMAGNIWEWVADWYEENYYATLAENVPNPQGPSSGQYRVLRGGSWDSVDLIVRSANRSGNDPTYTSWDIGFRCAMSATQ